MNLDQFTFGNTLPAIWLVDKLNELDNKNATRAVSQFLQNSNQTINAIGKIPDTKSLIALATLYRKDIQERLNANINIPEYMKSRMANILVTKLTILIRDMIETDEFIKFLKTVKPE